MTHQQAGVSAALRELADKFLGNWIGSYDPEESHWIMCKGALAKLLAQAQEAALASAPPEQAAPDENIWSEVRRLQEIRLRAVVTQEPTVAFSADDMKFVLSLIDQRDRAVKELIRAKPDQSQSASDGALALSEDEVITCILDSLFPSSKVQILAADTTAAIKLASGPDGLTVQINKMLEQRLAAQRSKGAARN